jgi:hypothetical protein
MKAHFKFIIFINIIILIEFNSFAQSSGSPRDIKFYFDHLPDSCFKLCNWRDPDRHYFEKIVDVKNGFISFKRDKDFPDFFQMALFKGSNNIDVIVVSNRECEAFACFTPTSYFYQYKNNVWIPADNEIFPKITPENFYKDSYNYDLLNKYGYYSYNFILPQNGTKIKIEIDICDYLQEDHPEVTDDQYKRLVNERMIIYLNWNNKSNRFTIE